MPYLKISSSPADRRGVLTESTGEPGSRLRRGLGELAGREGHWAALCLPILGVPMPPDCHCHLGSLLRDTLQGLRLPSSTCRPSRLLRAGCRSDERSAHFFSRDIARAKAPGPSGSGGQGDGRGVATVRQRGRGRGQALCAPPEMATCSVHPPPPPSRYPLLQSARRTSLSCTDRSPCTWP